jgi:hypothetical protein
VRVIFPLLLLSVVVGALLVAYALVRPPLPSVTRGALDPRRHEADADVLARVKSIAWDHRELDAPLADDLIAYLNEHEDDADLRPVRNELAEIAWRHRDDSPDLSQIVRDVLRE